MKFIAIDSGKFATKAATLKADGTERIIVFRTKMEETIKDEAKGKSFIVTYGGKKYLVGEQAETLSSKSTKAEELHKIATYTALHQLADSSDELIVAIGCPLSVYENANSRKAYRDFIFPSKQIDITVDNFTKHLNVKTVVVLPESSGVIYLNQAEYEDSSVGVIDIGGLNVNCCVYNKTVPVLSTLFTENLGSNVLLQNMKNDLSVQYNEDIPQFMMEDIMKQGFVRDNMAADGILAGSKEFIANCKKAHVQSILKKCEANGWNLRTMRIVITGGTSEMLREEIKAVLPGAVICEDASKANVRGFLKAIAE